MGAQAPRDVLFRVRGGVDRAGTPAHPVAGRPTRAREVPPAARPGVRAEEDGRARTGRARPRQRHHRPVRRQRRVRLPRGVRHAAAVDDVPAAHGDAAVRPAAVPAMAGRHHPAEGRPRRLGRRATHPRGDRLQDHPVLRGGDRGAPPPPRRQQRARPHRRRRGRRPSAHRRGAARHLPPAPARRPRHRHRDARLRDRLPRPPSGTAPSAHRRPQRPRGRHRRTAAHRDARHGGAACREAGHDDRRRRGTGGRPRDVVPRRGEQRRRRVRRRARRRLRPHAEPSPGVRRRAAPLPRLAPRPPRTARRARGVPQANHLPLVFGDAAR